MLQKPIKNSLQADQCEHTSTPECFPSGSSTPWCDNKTCGRIFPAFYPSCTDAPDFLKFTSSSGTSTETTERQEWGSSRCFAVVHKVFCLQAIVSNSSRVGSSQKSLPAACWAAWRDGAGSSCWTDVCDVGRVSGAGMAFISRSWRMGVCLYCSCFSLGRLNRIPDFRDVHD